MCLQQAQLHPSLACHAQLYKDKQTTHRTRCLPITAAVALGPEYTGNVTIRGKALFRAICLLFVVIKSHMASPENSFWLYLSHWKIEPISHLLQVCGNELVFISVGCTMA